MRKHLRTTALLSALVCGTAVLAFVPIALGAEDPPQTLMCHRLTQTISVPTYLVPRRQAAGDTIGACIVTPSQGG